VSLPGKREPTARPAATVARATATATRTAATATPTARTPAATATPTVTATPAAPSKGRAIALRDEPRDVIVYRDAVWVTTPGTHAVRRVDPSTRVVKTIKLEPDADPRQMEAGLGALWVDSWTNAFTRIDAATGDWKTVYMPTKSKSGYGFAVGDGGAWALDRQHGILYTLDAATGQPDGDGLQLGGPAIDAVATGGIVYVLLKPQLLGKVDARTGTFYDSIRLPARPVGIERERSKLVVGFAGDRFASYDAGTLRHTKLFSMGREWERGETFRSELWVTVPNADAIHRFDTRTGAQLGEPIAFDSTPVALNFEPSGRAWVGLQSGALLPVDVPRS
jgi:streptogramin lyase